MAEVRDIPESQERWTCRQSEGAFSARLDLDMANTSPCTIELEVKHVETVSRASLGSLREYGFGVSHVQLSRLRCMPETSAQGKIAMACDELVRY